MTTLKYLLLILITLWLFGFLYVLNNNTSGSQTQQSHVEREKAAHRGDAARQRNDMYGAEEDLESGLRERLKQAFDKIDMLQKRNEENEKIIRSLQANARRFDANSSNCKCEPSKETETLRRKIFGDVRDIFFYVTAQTSRQLREQSYLDDFKAIIKHRSNIVLANLVRLSNADWLEGWRQSKWQSLNARIVERIDSLQNPSDCSKAKKIVCDLNKTCGFGCQLHHVLYCFITAYFTNRTLTIEPNKWHYNADGYEAYFKPVSKACRVLADSGHEANGKKKSYVDWGEPAFYEAERVKMPIIDVLTHKPPFLPLAVPKELENDLLSLQGAPFVWWAGQLLSYFMRFNDKFQEVVDKYREQFHFEAPCVGIHVRRTDKVGTEASYHDIDEYMREVNQYFEIHELISNKSIATRRIYLATDDVQVHKEAVKKYPDYTFIFDESFSKSASMNQRYTPSSAQGVILDIYFLSQCDYLVCTFSSQVCRLAYELMQIRFPNDASWRFRSLDDVYYYGGQTGHDVRAIFDHEPNLANGEIALKRGDLVGIAGNHWNGFSKGLNHRTNEEGLFPSYKVEETVVLV